MNTNGNTYTIVYSTIIVVLVAAILAFASSALKPMQDANIKAETISQMLDAAGIQAKDTPTTNEQILDKYAETVTEAFVIDLDGKKIKDLSIDRKNLELQDDLKAQNTNIKNGKDALLPVYKFNNGTTVIPVYGAGLWGPVWGYVAFKEDLKTIAGAYFDHASETPGLGAKIKDDPSFRALFQGKTADFQAEPAFAIVKGASAANEVDAITGATMTSKGLSAAIGTWFKAYAAYFVGNAAPVDEKHCCKQHEGCEEHANCEEHEGSEEHKNCEHKDCCEQHKTVEE
ncbi:MAG: NADH:ubiquinone reductase (Na(+)-transporting) subunit C [Bacteroidales bacterium]|nr:NADH:ubiquinone reductase (Na(+)-transporting) subunit C [Bacteroidales bacterium]